MRLDLLHISFSKLMVEMTDVIANDLRQSIHENQLSSTKPDIKKICKNVNK